MGEIDWAFVSMYYDYIWSYGEVQSQSDIEQIADKVFEDILPILYRVRTH